MSRLPIQPRRKSYRGSKGHLKLRVIEHNRMAQEVADYLNKLIANDSSDVQTYLFASLAHDLRLTVEEVRSALPGGYNGITVGVDPLGRQAMTRFVKNLSSSTEAKPRRQSP